LDTDVGNSKFCRNTIASGSRG